MLKMAVKNAVSFQDETMPVPEFGFSGVQSCLHCFTSPEIV